jgi:lipid-binding SYLF domain-containing protein
MLSVRTATAILTLLALAVTMVTVSPAPRPAAAASSGEIDRDVNSALAKMYDSVPESRNLGRQARAVLVFPSIVKAGFLFGAQYGEGGLVQRGRVSAYYNTVSASYGLQAGVQTFGYALFFMSDGAVQYLNNSGGFELGTGPSIAIFDAGMARSLSTTTAHSDIYAIFFDQRGLMAGAGLQGTKITRLDR